MRNKCKDLGRYQYKIGCLKVVSSWWGGEAIVIHPRLEMLTTSAGVRRWEIPPKPKIYLTFSKRRINRPLGSKPTHGAPANVLPKADKK